MQVLLLLSLQSQLSLAKYRMWQVFNHTTFSIAYKPAMPCWRCCPQTALERHRHAEREPEQRNHTQLSPTATLSGGNLFRQQTPCGQKSKRNTSPHQCAHHQKALGKGKPKLTELWIQNRLLRPHCIFMWTLQFRSKTPLVAWNLILFQTTLSWQLSTSFCLVGTRDVDGDAAEEQCTVWGAAAFRFSCPANPGLPETHQKAAD